MNTKIHYIFIIFGLIIGLNSCFKKETYPLEPVVSYNSFTVFGANDSAQIKIDFTDGDGDIGLYESDTLTPYHFKGENYYNLILYYFEKDDQLGWVKGKDANGNPIVFNFRLNPILDYGKTKGIKGTMSYNFKLFYNLQSSQSDTVRYEFILKDRALNISNIGVTDSIILF